MTRGNRGKKDQSRKNIKGSIDIDSGYAAAAEAYFQNQVARRKDRRKPVTLPTLKWLERQKAKEEK